MWVAKENVCDFFIILQKYNCNWDHWWCDVYDKTFLNDVGDNFAIDAN